MDQSATTAAYVSGMQESLSLYGNELVQFTTLFSIGYALVIVPSQLLQTRIRPSLVLPICEMLWGLLTLVTYRATTAKSVYILRFFLGIFEGTSWTGLANLLFNWYTPRELGLRIAIFGVSGQVGNMFLGILQAALYNNLNGAHGLAGWQWLFIVSGIITMFWGFLGLFTIPDTPPSTRALYLSKYERQISQSRMVDAGIKTAELISPQKLLQALKRLFRTPITYLFLAAYVQFAWSLRANSYILLWLKSLKDASGQPRYSVAEVNLIPLGGYSIYIVTSIGLNALSDWKGWRWQVACGTAVIQFVATTALATWPSSTSTVYGFYFLTYATGSWGYAMIAWMSEILGKEPEARSVLIGLAVCIVYVGHATIPLGAWKTTDSPRFHIGFPMAATFSVGSIIIMLALRYYVNRNPQILENGLEGTKEHEEDGLQFESEGRHGRSF
ncbi:major facilitator superfamily domain-containing protein [Xylariales sp. PMI_506]|nr:major facilitator superfamily domain-containing protein [Xylariales sp. PMI_506]